MALSMVALVAALSSSEQDRLVLAVPFWLKELQVLTVLLVLALVMILTLVVAVVLVVLSSYQQKLVPLLD